MDKGTISLIVVSIVPVLGAVTIHEVAHGWVAYLLGDPTPKLSGRLSFNPLKHLDIVGTAVFLLTRVIGWAKPVPINPFNLKNPKKDMMWIALAGPASNIILALILSPIHSFIGGLEVESKILIKILMPIYLMVKIGIIVNIGLAIFNLIPIPPLDGSRILSAFLPSSLYYRFQELEKYGFIIILIAIFTGVLDRTIVPLIYKAISLLINV